MNKTEKAPGSAATLTGAGRAAAYGMAAASSNDCTSKIPEGQSKISDLLSTGQENAVPLCHLVKLTGHDGRTVRRMISEERFAGVPILADNQTGYYLPASEAEKRRCVRSMRHRAKEIDRAAQAIEAADIQKDYGKPAQRVPEASAGQMRMEGV